MDYSMFMTVPVLSILAVFAGIVFFIGHLFGYLSESKKREVELKELKEGQSHEISTLTTEHKEKTNQMITRAAKELAALKQSKEGEIAQLKSSHENTIEAMRASHQAEVEKLNQQHSDLIKQLNDSNIENVKQIKGDYEAQIADLTRTGNETVVSLQREHKAEMERLKSESKQSLEALKSEHAKGLSQLKQEHLLAIDALKAEQLQIMESLKQDSKERITEAAQRHSEEVTRLENEKRALASDLQGQIENLQNRQHELEEEKSTLEGTLRELGEQSREEKLNNMFSMSKSGDKLIRVVRSVQELANELDVTSKAVTGGEYSFFNEIKDQRDRATVLGLTGGEKVMDVNEHGNEESDIVEHDAGAVDDSREQEDQ